MEERELVRRVLDGDKSAQTEFFLVHRDRLYRTCVYFLGYQDPEAEDIVQEAFIIALRKLPEFEFKASLNTWLTQICVFLCYKRLHKRHRAVLSSHEELEALAKPIETDPGAREEAAFRERVLGLIRDCMDKISVECRRLLKMRDQDNKSYALIGEEMKVPIGTVMSRLSRCREALKVLVKNAMGSGSNG